MFGSFRPRQPDNARPERGARCALRGVMRIRVAFVVLLSVLVASSASAQEHSCSSSKKICDLQKKAIEGDPESQYELGLSYEQASDWSQAAHWYELAAHHGNPQGQNNLGALYATGRG